MIKFKAYKKKRFSYRIIVLFSLLLALFLPLMLNLNFLLVGPVDSKGDLSFVPRINGIQDINIITPKNKTYTTPPMSGYYPGTFSFENDEDNSDPEGWTIIENGGTVNVIPEFDNHKKVVELSDTGFQEINAMNYTFSDKTTGTIEFWWATNDNLKLNGFEVFDDSTKAFQINMGTGNFTFWNRSVSFDSGIINENNLFYHHKIEFDCVSNSFSWHINGILALSNITFENTDSVNKFRFVTGWSAFGMKQYVDAVGFSWDPKYSIGDNLNEGMWLSYDSSVNQVWTGYSLDGNDNVTISGNTTIPMPNYGKHTIQVFGNESSGTVHESEVRHFTIAHLVIITPENKTYTAPMSEYYPGTFSFENDEDNSDPEGWTIIENGGTVNVIPEFDNHKKVVELSDTGFQEINAMNYSFSDKTTGTIEFWWATDDASKGTNLEVYDGATKIMQVAVSQGNFYYYNGSSIDTGIVVTNNMFYHHRIEFDCASYSYSWYINGGLIKANIEFLQNTASINNFRFVTAWSPYNMKMYVDAVGVSWDPSYTIGDNLNEGIWLSYDNKVNLYWTGYSIDGQANVTISGNTTIPMPSDGDHTIQLFGIDSQGNIYETTIRHFFVDINAPTSSLAFTPYSEPNIVLKSTEFSITADDGLGSGVSVIKYRINNSGWIDYIGPFDLSDFDPGYYNISYYSIDNVNHIETIKAVLVVLIEVPPGTEIPGYDMFLVVGIICIVSIYILKKRYKIIK